MRLRSPPAPPKFCSIINQSCLMACSNIFKKGILVWRTTKPEKEPRMCLFEPSSERASLCLQVDRGSASLSGQCRTSRVSRCRLPCPSLDFPFLPREGGVLRLKDSPSLLMGLLASSSSLASGLGAWLSRSERLLRIICHENCQLSWSVEKKDHDEPMISPRLSDQDYNRRQSLRFD